MSKKEKKIIIILIIVLLFIDQLIKILFLTTNIKIGNTEGFCLGILERKASENNLTYILISFVAIIALIRYIKSDNSYIKMNNRILLSLAIAGVISNVIDRIWSKGDINYINLPSFISVNLGHIYFIITWIGMAIILTRYTSERIAEKKKSEQSKKEKNKSNHKDKK